MTLVSEYQSTNNDDVKGNSDLDQDDFMPLLAKELNKVSKAFIKEGFSPKLAMKALNTASRMVVKKIKELAISMENFDMKEILSTFLAAYLPKKPFVPYQKHLARIIVEAVHATGYDYEDFRPFDSTISDFEDGFNLIGINEVPGGRVDDSFFVEGIALKLSVSGAHGFEKLKVVDNPKILLLNIKPDRKSKKKKDKRLYDTKIYDMVDKHVNHGANVVLSCQAIGDSTKQYLANRHIFYADLVDKYDLHRVADATCSAPLITFNYSPIDLGSCQSFQERKFGNEVFGIFSGCSSEHKAATIVLRGDDQFIKEAALYLPDTIAFVRSAMKDYTLVAGGRKLYEDISRYVLEAANDVGEEDLQPIIKAFAKAIKIVSDKTRENNAGYDAVNNMSQKQTVATSEGGTFWEPPSLKIHVIGCATKLACLELTFLTLDDDDDDEATSSKRKSKHAKRARC